MLMYTFRSILDQTKLTGTADLDLEGLGLSRTLALVQAGQYGAYLARMRGSLLALFGPPISQTAITDPAYTYSIQATNDQARTWYLSVAQTSSGVSIGGDATNPSLRDVAEALLQRIEATPPVDFEHVLYDDDLDTTVTYGCRQGECYWHEQRGNHRTRRD